MTDVLIADVLASEGFTGESAQVARSVLEEAGLTRAGKVRISNLKLPRVREVLHARLARVCGDRTCAAVAGSREPVVVPREHCEACEGSNIRRAARVAGEALRRRQIGQVLVVGGTPSTHAGLRSALEAEDVTVRCVDGTAGIPNRRVVAADLAWADVVVLWASTPLPHKVSQLYTGLAAPGSRVITVARRSPEAVCQALSNVRL